MSEEQYYLHRDGKGRCLLQNVETGIVEGLVFPGMPGESARAFSYDYGTVWYPEQLLNLADFPELAEMPFFTIESCGHSELSRYLQQTEFQSIWPLLGTLAKLLSLYPENCQSVSAADHPDIVRWQYNVVNPNGSWTIPILDVWVNEQGCWFCTREGQVLVINHNGELIQQYALSKLTRCIAGWEDTPVVSCEDGQLYDLSAKLPQAVYSVRATDDRRYSYQILAVEHTGERLLVADAYGQIQVLDSDYALLWQSQQQDWQSWFLCSDATLVYQGYYRGLRAYDLETGEEQWHQSLAAPVLCGSLTQQEVIVGCSDRTIYALSKTEASQAGSFRAIYTCTGVPYVLKRSPDEHSLFIGDYTGKIEQIDSDGNLKAAIQLQAGAITSLDFWGDHLYVTTSQGILLCLDCSAG